MSDKRQTAVEWMVSELRKLYGDQHMDTIIEKAKEMESQNIQFAFRHGEQCQFEGMISTGRARMSPLDYYEQVYGDKK